jgi:hypothetical protein
MSAVMAAGGHRRSADLMQYVQYLMAFASTSFRVRAGGDDDFSEVLFADADEFVSDVVRISDTLSNLTYLIELDAQNPGLVRQYAKQADQTAAGAGRPGSFGRCSRL